MALTTLPEWLSYLETLHPQAIDLGLERVKKVADKLNIQHPATKVVTVTGTNGKGSCVAALAAIYQQAGYRVGAYSSPHLWHFTERILINGIPVAEKDLCAQFIKIEQARENISLTYFEFTTLAALLIFQQQNLDLVILEVGMGGRLDAVNIIDPDIAVITTVDLDHQAWLGETCEKIGYEKAGIMRTGIPVVCGREMPNSVYQTAQTQDVRMYVLGKNFDVKIVNTQEFFWQANEKILINLPRNHLLVDNLALSLMVVA
ncbi:MAG: bifunctional folylpolyglutamate synthase/dihydrofolate synthase, partial [Gammaproteobacteria bacterium]